MKIEKTNGRIKGKIQKKINQTKQRNKKLFNVQWKLTQAFGMGYRNMAERSL